MLRTLGVSIKSRIPRIGSEVYGAGPPKFRELHISGYCLTRWWFETFLEFSPRKLGKMSHLTFAYFSDGLVKKTTNQLMLFHIGEHIMSCILVIPSSPHFRELTKGVNKNGSPTIAIASTD